jgi:hypothetical protein
MFGCHPIDWANDLGQVVAPARSAKQGLLGDGLFVEEYSGIHSWVECPTRYTVIHSRETAILFVDTRQVDAIAFHHDILGADDRKSYFTLPVWRRLSG